ncbi:aminotransferase class III-fold pyridoxal phosphate-dependent enzyme [Streptomyces sp. NPDC059832]|uniref:aminotransferase class III-fold pyridoxal phosphate-dependent enzyme n=1 Tax=unclassified Streptomyces TaxID=2593676 RepID=UPI00365BF0AB
MPDPTDIGPTAPDIPPTIAGSLGSDPGTVDNTLVHQYGDIPGLTCLAKVIGGGLSCGAVVGRAEFIDMTKSSQDPFSGYENRIFAGGTLSGNPLTCAAGVAPCNISRHIPSSTAGSTTTPTSSPPC